MTEEGTELNCWGEREDLNGVWGVNGVKEGVGVADVARYGESLRRLAGEEFEGRDEGAL